MVAVAAIECGASQSGRSKKLGSISCEMAAAACRQAAPTPSSPTPLPSDNVPTTAGWGSGTSDAAGGDSEVLVVGFPRLRDEGEGCKGGTWCVVPEASLALLGGANDTFRRAVGPTDAAMQPVRVGCW